jgi:formylglycine-generating enzyme required for sulfatase activity
MGWTLNRLNGWVGLGVLAGSWWLAPPAWSQCVAGDVNGDGLVNGIDLSVVLSQWNASCPAVISSVTPGAGPIAGGTAITITGENLGDVQSVTIGGLLAVEVVGIDPTTITAVTPAGKKVGPQDVVVTTTAGSVTLAEGFRFTPPEGYSVIEQEPDPKVVTDAALRAAILATGLPWRVRDNVTEIEMLLVPPGTFDMGCSASLASPCDPDEFPVHEVTLTQAFYLGRYEVTQAQWTAIMGSNPSVFNYPTSEVPADQVPNRPVERVSWNLIQEFEEATGLRLPTEAEWEYACRGGTTTAFSNGSDDDASIGTIAWYEPNSGFQTHPVGTKLGNPLGFHDMSGNVWEWVDDWYGATYYEVSPPIDPPGPASGDGKVLRGGSWFFVPFFQRSSYRGDGFDLNYNSADIGVRLVRDP